jgi:hypothetical protein
LKTVLIQIPGGKSRERTPELREALRQGTVEAVRKKLRDESSAGVKAWIQVGRAVASVKANADEDGPKVFDSLFAKSAAERKDEKRFPFSRSTGVMLMAIAEKFGAVSTANTAFLPTAWYTLYILTRIPIELMQALIDAGTVHALMTRAEATKLCAKPKPKANKPDVMTMDRAVRIAHKGLDALAEKNRAMAIINLMHDFKITLKELEALYAQA